MDKDTKVFVSIYCKIYSDTFDDKMIDRLATGTEIYGFLMEDASHCFTEDGQIIPGDCNLWYLGCNEKFGELVLENKVWKWSFGESSFDNVEGFVIGIYKMGVITRQQYRALTDKIKGGRLIDNMYDIGAYLICKRDGIVWNKTENASKFRDEMKRFVGSIEQSYQQNGYRVYR